MDIKRALRSVNETGKVSVGFKQTIKLLKKGKVRLVLLSNNCPPDQILEIKTHKVPIYTFSGNNVDFGSACGKPFSISTLGIVEQGKSDILALKGDNS